MCRGAAGTRAEAEALAQALCTAGTVLRFRNKVYLRPDEVAHGVLSVRSSPPHPPPPGARLPRPALLSRA